TVLPSLSVTVNSFLSAVMLLILPFTSSASTGVASATNRIMASALKNHLGRRIMVSPSIEETQSPLPLTTRDRPTQTTIESPREPRERVFLLFSYLQNQDREFAPWGRGRKNRRRPTAGSAVTPFMNPMRLTCRRTNCKQISKIRDFRNFTAEHCGEEHGVPRRSSRCI